MTTDEFWRYKKWREVLDPRLSPERVAALTPAQRGRRTRFMKKRAKLIARGRAEYAEFIKHSGASPGASTTAKSDT